MGMFRTPYGKGGVLSKEADEARKKLYKDIRPLELQRKEKRLLIACYFFQLPFLLIPGFFSKPALSHKLFLTLPYGMCIIQVFLASVRFLGYLRKEGTVDGWTYQKLYPFGGKCSSFLPFCGNPSSIPRDLSPKRGKRWRAFRRSYGFSFGFGIFRFFHSVLAEVKTELFFLENGGKNKL